MSAERRIHRAVAATSTEQVLALLPGNTTETTNSWNVPNGKVYRITDHMLTTLCAGAVVYRIRKGTTTAGEEIARYVLNGVQTFQPDFKTPFRLDGGSLLNGQDFVLTAVAPGESGSCDVSWTVVGQQD